MTHAIEIKKDRIIALDVLKAIGVFFMIILHTFFWIVITDDSGASGYPEGMFETVFFLKMIGFLVLLLPVTAGASFYFYLKKKNLHATKKTYRSIILRCLALIALGFILNVAAFGFDDFFSWDFLHFIGVSFLILTLFQFLPIVFLILFSFVTLLLAPVLRSIFEYEKATSYFSIVLLGDVSGNNYWAFFPWFFFIGFGYIVIHYYNKGFFKSNRNQFVVVVLCNAIIAASIALGDFFVVEDVTNAWGPSIFLPPISRVLASVSIFMLLFLLFDNLKVHHVKKYGFVNTLSKGILYIYILHIIVGFHLINYVKLHYPNITAYMLSTFFLILFSYLIGCFVIVLKDMNGKKK